MEYELALFTDMSLVELAQYIYDVLRYKMEIEVEYVEEENHITVSCEYINFYFNTEEMIDLAFFEEEYLFEANASIWMQMFNKTFDKGIDLLFKMLGLISEDRTDNFLLMENGGIVVLLRKNGEFYTYIHNLLKKNDIYYTRINKGYTTDYPFGFISRELIEV